MSVTKMYHNQPSGLLYLLFICLTLMSLALVGCATHPPLYHWGGYQTALYSHMLHDSKFTPTEEIAFLRKDQSQSQREGDALPPGFHAHLGYLYYQVGNREMARTEFLTEKKRFPESTVLIERFLKK